MDGPGAARPGPAGTFNNGLEGPKTLLQVLSRTGVGGYINQGLTLLLPLLLLHYYYHHYYYLLALL